MEKKSFDSVTYELPKRYDAVKLLGAGSYGHVVAAIDKITNAKVAIKKLRNIEDSVDAKRSLRELLILKNLNHENILNLKDVVLAPSVSSPIGDLYLVTDLMQTELHRILKVGVELTDEHISYIIYQLLKAIYYIHSANIIHRDIKPSNILVNESCDIKLCDFGLSRTLSIEKNENLTEYVVTRFYRAPEVMLSSHHYGMEVDMWSVGCTFAEMLSRKILFPGENYIEQINMIVGICGKPSKEDMAFVTNEHAVKYLQSLPNRARIDIHKMIKYSNSNALDLLDKMIIFNPKKRISVIDALKHPYLSTYFDQDDLKKCKSDIDFSFEENKALKIGDLKKMIIKYT